MSHWVQAAVLARVALEKIIIYKPGVECPSAIVPSVRQYRRCFSTNPPPQWTGKRDPFRVLEIPRNAHPKVVKDAYYERAKRLHPDALGKQDEATAKRSRNEFSELTDSFKYCFQWAKSTDPATWVNVATPGTAHEEGELSLMNMDLIIEQAQVYYEMEWNGKRTSNSGPDWGGYFWMMNMYGDAKTEGVNAASPSSQADPTSAEGGSAVNTTSASNGEPASKSASDVESTPSSASATTTAPYCP